MFCTEGTRNEHWIHAIKCAIRASSLASTPGEMSTEKEQIEFNFLYLYNKGFPNHGS